MTSVVPAATALVMGGTGPAETKIQQFITDCANDANVSGHDLFDQNRSKATKLDYLNKIPSPMRSGTSVELMAWARLAAACHRRAPPRSIAIPIGRTRTPAEAAL